MRYSFINLKILCNGNPFWKRKRSDYKENLECYYNFKDKDKEENQKNNEGSNNS